MKLILTSVFLLLALCSYQALAIITRCPTQQEIKVTPIPHSFNAVYSANVNGILYGGYGDIASKKFPLPFRKAVLQYKNFKYNRKIYKKSIINCVYANVGTEIVLQAGAGQQILVNAIFVDSPKLLTTMQKSDIQVDIGILPPHKK